MAGASFTRSTSVFHFEVIIKAILIPLQAAVGPKSWKAVAVQHDCDILVVVVKYTRVVGICNKPSIFHHLCVCVCVCPHTICQRRGSPRHI